MLEKLLKNKDREAFIFNKELVNKKIHNFPKPQLKDLQKVEFKVKIGMVIIEIHLKFKIV